jgi:hypothetical protein
MNEYLFCSMRAKYPTNLMFHDLMTLILLTKSRNYEKFNTSLFPAAHQFVSLAIYSGNLTGAAWHPFLHNFAYN